VRQMTRRAFPPGHRSVFTAAGFHRGKLLGMAIQAQGPLRLLKHARYIRTVDPVALETVLLGSRCMDEFRLEIRGHRFVAAQAKAGWRLPEQVRLVRAMPLVAR